MFWSQTGWASNSTFGFTSCAMWTHFLSFQSLSFNVWDNKSNKMYLTEGPKDKWSHDSECATMDKLPSGHIFKKEVRSHHFPPTREILGKHKPSGTWWERRKWKAIKGAKRRWRGWGWLTTHPSPPSRFTHNCFSVHRDEGWDSYVSDRKYKLSASDSETGPSCPEKIINTIPRI